MHKISATQITMILAAIFVVVYTIVVSLVYPNTLRMMEANCWVDDYVLQFFRWPVLGAFLMSLPMCGAMLLGGLVLKVCRQSRFMPFSLGIALALAYCYPPAAEYNWGENHLFDDYMQEYERIYNYQRLTDQKEWDMLIKTIREDGTGKTTLGLRYLLLAESANHTLADNLFSYSIKETEEFLFRAARTSPLCTFNRQFYDNIGIWDECYHQAQEYAMTQRNFCLQSICQMIDYSIKEAEWQVAEKLLCVMEQALFYGDFVKERRAQVVEGKRVKPENDAPLRQDNFVTGYSMQNEFARDIQYQIGDQEKIQEYIACCMLIRKKLPQFCKTLNSLPRYKKPMNELPECFQQAFEIYNSNGEALREALPGTYAYFYYNIEIPEKESRFEVSTIN